MLTTHHHPKLMAIAIALAFSSTVVHAATDNPNPSVQSSAIQHYALEPMALDEALSKITQQSGKTISADPKLLAGKQSASINGDYSAEQAIEKALIGNGLVLQITPSGSFTIKKAQIQSMDEVEVESAKDEAALQNLPEVIVAATSSSLPTTYAGGQVARGGRAGLLGNKDMMDTPFSVTQYTSKLIEDQQAQNLGDVLINDPSVRNTYSRGAGRDEFNIRGFTLFNQDVMFNGIYGVAPRNSSTLIGIERVEVLRGPNALLNGIAPSGSVGGAINLVPKRAGLDPLNRLTLSYMDDSQLGAHFDVARRFGDDKAFGVRVNGIKRSGDTPVDNSKESLDALAIGLDFQGDRVRVDGDLNYQNRRTDARSGLLFPPAAGTRIGSAPDADSNFFPEWTYWKTNEISGALRSEFDVTDKWTLFGAIAGMRYDFNSLQNSWLLQNTDGAIAGRPARLDEYVKTHSTELGLKGKFTTASLQHEPVVSLSSYTSESGSLRVRAASNIFSNVYAPLNLAEPDIVMTDNIPKAGETKLRSVALADTISNADKDIQLTVGLRHQSVETASYDAVSGARTASYDKSKVTPMATLVIKPTQQLSFYGNYIQGLVQGPTAPSTAANAGEIFAPMVTKQYEVGAKYDFGRFATTLAAFQIERPSSFQDPTTLRFSTDGEQRNRGLELVTQGEVVDNVRLLGGLAYTEGKLTKTQSGTNDGNTAPAVPKLQFNLSGEWDTFILPGLTLTGRMVHTSPQYVDVGNTQELPSWTRYDLGARYAFNVGNTPVSIRGQIENIFDKSYWQSSAREGLTVGGPRTVLLSVSADF
jgi:iron complex outermembrane recepter protein